MENTSVTEPYFDLGSYHRRITTVSNDAQQWFDRGLIWTYAFNHEEAAHCFEQALSFDPDCSMAYWGLAFALGPNYNKPWDFFEGQELEKHVERTHHTASEAQSRCGKSNFVEQSLINALQKRYPQTRIASDFSAWNEDYANAMAVVYGDFGDDLDVAALYADALMNLTPWRLWDLKTGRHAQNAHTGKIKAVLDRALAQDNGNQHPGLLHLYIHLMEMSPNPETALNVADNLRGLVPDAGHLQHMPTHLDILCGDYRRAIASNADAIQADQKFLSRRGQINFYTLYRAHNYHFRIYAAMLVGQSQTAIQTVTELEASIPETLLRVQSPPMADWLEGFLPIRVHVLIRFGLWEDIIGLQLPVDQDLFCVTAATIHYAKGVAFSAMERLHDAEVQRRLFFDAFSRVKPSRTLFNNKCTDILRIAQSMFDGELEYRRGNLETAFTHLRHAIELDDGLPYDEPWGWMQPTRHAYGALLLEQGHIEEAAAIYSADLGLDSSLPRALTHPNNVWSLYGYHACLIKLERLGEATIIGAQLQVAMAVADVPIKASCFCGRPCTEPIE